MKKKLSLLLILLASIFGSYAQDAQKIMSDFLALTGLDNHKNETMRVDISMNIQGNDIPMIISFDSDRSKMRLEMQMQGTTVSMVVVGDEGWVESEGEKQPLPKDFVLKTKAITFFASVSDLISKCKFSYLKGDELSYEINVTTNKNVGSFNVKVDKSTGYITKVVMLDDSKATLDFSNYSKFVNVLLPSKIVAKDATQNSSEFTINAIAFGVSFPDWYFKK